METFRVTSPDISCEHCKATIEHDVGEMPGVDNVFVNVPQQQVTVAYDPQEVSEGSIVAKLEEIGYASRHA